MMSLREKILLHNIKGLSKVKVLKLNLLIIIKILLEKWLLSVSISWLSKLKLKWMHLENSFPESCETIFVIICWNDKMIKFI